MSDDNKKMLWVAIAVVAIVAAVGSAFYVMRADQVQVVRQGPKPAPGQLWGKAAMVAHDTHSNPGAPPKGSGAAAGSPGP